MSFSRWARGLALALVLALLSGCSNDPAIIIVDPAQLYGGSQTNLQDGNSEFFLGVDGGGNTGAGTDEFIAPAPGTQKQEADTPSVAPTPRRNDLSSLRDRADLIIGVVVDDEAVLHPLRCRTRDFYNLNALVFEGLFELDDTLKPVPVLVDTWYYADGEWTFNLRSGTKFHNGMLLSAADVVASYEDALLNSGTMWYPLITNIHSMRAEGDLTVKVRSKGMGQMLLYAMTFPIVQRSTINSADPMGTGPYWNLGYSVSKSVHLESNALWWRHSDKEVHTILALCYRSTIEAMAAVESGEIHVLATRSNTAALSRSLSDRMTMDYSTTTYECVVPNLRDDILMSLRVRQALMYAIDRSTLANSSYLGMVQESEVPVVPGSWLYDAQATRFNYSPERALRFLYDDGWQDYNGDGILEKEINGILEDLRLSLITYNEGISPIRAEAAYAIAEQLRKIGIAVDVSVKTKEEAGKRLKDGNFQLALVSYNLNQIPDLSFMLNHSASLNYSKYDSDSMEALLEEAYGAITEEVLTNAMSRIQIKMVDELPILGLFFRTGVVVSKKSVGGLHGLREGQALRGLEAAVFR